MKKYYTYIGYLNLLILLFFSCSKWNMDKVNPIISNLKVEYQSGNTATLSCTIEVDKSSREIDERGFVYGKDIVESNNYFKKIDGNLGEMRTSINNLDWSSNYYINAYIVVEEDTFYSKQKVFETNEPSVSFGSTSISSITAISASLSGSIVLSEGTPMVTEKGFVYGTSSSPTVDNQKIEESSSGTSLYETIGGLSPSTIYYVRAYAINSEDSFYSSETNFTTEDGSVSFGSTSISSITASSASLSGSIVLSAGTPLVTEKGFVYGTSSSPTVDNQKIEESSSGTSLYETISGLSPSTIYYVRAYAINSIGTFYSAETNFTTEDGSISFGSTSIISITASSASLSGSIVLSAGTPSVTEKGFVYGTSSSPTVNSQKVEESSLGTSLYESISGLSPSTTYYVRAYAINSEGTFYSSETNFTTDDGSISFGTTSVSNVTASSANFSGSIIVPSGTPTVTDKGFVYGTSSSPTVNSQKVEESSLGTSLYESISGLSPSTTYYVRAYAINSEGTFYSSETNFTTDDGVFDDDGNLYSVVTIGNQKWMAENLRISHSGNYYDYFGTIIENTSIYYYYYSAYSEYGIYYNGEIILSSDICPIGYRIPTYDDVKELQSYINDDANKLKSKEGWNGNGNDEFGFNAKPYGYYKSANHPDSESEHFAEFGNMSLWWTKTKSGDNYSLYAYGFGSGSSLNIWTITANIVNYNIRCIKN